MSIGKKLLSLRQEKGISQEAFYKLIRNNMIYKLDYSYLENEKIDYSGTLSNKVEIIINKIKNNLGEN